MSSFFSKVKDIFKKENILYPNLHKLLDNLNDAEINKEFVDMHTLDLTLNINTKTLEIDKNSKLYNEFKISLTQLLEKIDAKQQEKQHHIGGSKKKHSKKSKKHSKKSKKSKK